MATISFKLLNEDGSETEHTLSATFEVCSRCRGEGSHTNPSIDGNGITGEEMAEVGEDFCEDYLSGVYDVSCEQCRGERVVAVVDRPRCDPKLLKEYDRQQRDEADYQAICSAERRRGA